MIDKSEFTAGLALLAAAFSRDLDEPVIVAYYRVLSPKLATDEFQRAVQILLDSETFWPTPAKILHAIYPPTAASLALAEVVDRLRSFGGHLYFPHAEFQKLTEGQKAGIKAVGGLAKINAADVEQMPKLERRFADGYNAVVSPQLAEPTAPKRIGPRSQPMALAKLIPAQPFGDKS